MWSPVRKGQEFVSKRNKETNKTKQRKQTPKQMGQHESRKNQDRRCSALPKIFSDPVSL